MQDYIFSKVKGNNFEFFAVEGNYMYRAPL